VIDTSMQGFKVKSYKTYQCFALKKYFNAAHLGPRAADSYLRTTLFVQLPVPSSDLQTVLSSNEVDLLRYST